MKNLIGVETNFAHTDSEELYKNNLLKYGKDWYYADNPVTYKFNKYGYRMKELDEVDYDNYYAFFGCSFTVGIGLNFEDTFAYKISNKAQVDFVNASMGGASVDFVFYNFVHLMNRAPKKPKLVFINWPSIHRTFYWNNKTHVQFMLPNIIEDGHWKRSYEDFIVKDDQVFNRFDLIKTTVKLICELSEVPLFQMSTHQDISKDNFISKYSDVISNIPISQDRYENSKYLHINRARDIIKNKTKLVSHPGLLHQDMILDRFFKVMK